MRAKHLQLVEAQDPAEDTGAPDTRTPDARTPDTGSPDSRTADLVDLDSRAVKTAIGEGGLAVADAVHVLGAMLRRDGQSLPPPLLARLVETLLPPFALFDAEGGRLFATESFARGIGEDARNSAFNAMLESVLAARRTGGPDAAVPAASPTLSGPDATYRVEIQDIGEAGGQTILLAILRDVTDMARALDQARLAQGKLRDFVECSSDWVWETDERGCIKSLSAQLTRLLGAPAAAFSGRRFKDLGRFVESELSDLVDTEAFQLRQRVHDLRFDVVDKDGKAVAQIISGAPVFDDRSGRFLGYRGTGTDISEQVAATVALEASRDQLSDALGELQEKNTELEAAFAAADAGNRAKSTFLANISHELRTPLNAILGFAEVLKLELFGTLGNDKYRNYSSDIYTSARHLLDLISNILDLSTLETGRKTLTMEVVDLVEEARYCLRLVEAEAGRKSLDLAIEAPPFAVLAIGDRRSMRQVLTNLLTNGVKFTLPGGSIAVSFASRDGQAGVIIRDTGVGIPEEDIERIVRPFERSATPYVRDQDGSGLGLALCQSLMILQGGVFGIESRLDEGTEVAVWLTEAPSEPDRRS
ncbi:MAG: PAS domain S-box protein [Alphaproteobacteria bacterium]|jgi:PAS domain S-box-containing protein|nr:PAS domain S-box protein [Alphaproteobacteria bacterium]